MAKRAERRHHRKRLIDKRRRLHYWNMGWGEPYGCEWTPKLLGMVASTPKTCSCWMCCNERKMEGDTRQERVSKIMFKEDAG